MAKFLPALTPHTDTLIAGLFTLRDLTQEYVITMFAKDESKLKITLASNVYLHF